MGQNLGATEPLSNHAEGTPSLWQSAAFLPGCDSLGRASVNSLLWGLVPLAGGRRARARQFHSLPAASLLPGSGPAGWAWTGKREVSLALGHPPSLGASCPPDEGWLGWVGGCEGQPPSARHGLQQWAPLARLKDSLSSFPGSCRYPNPSLHPSPRARSQTPASPSG